MDTLFAGRDQDAARALQYCLNNGPYEKIDSLLTLLSMENRGILSLLVSQTELMADGTVRMPPLFRDREGRFFPYAAYSFWTVLSFMKEKPLWLYGVESISFSNAPPSEPFRLPPSIKSLPALKGLGLEHCDLCEVPDEVFALRKLRSLSLRGNRLKSIPPGIGRLRQLVYFNAAENELEHLPPQLGHLKKLSVLDLSGNRLVSAGFPLEGLAGLNRLDLSGNYLDCVPEGIELLNQLEHVDLSFNDLSAAEEAAWESDHYSFIKNYQWHLTF